MSEPGAPRKPPRRIWLFLPYGLLALLALGYGAFWFIAEARLAREIEARAAGLRDAGYVVELTDRRASGFPFRMKLRFGQARIASPSGWSIAAPGLEGEAYLHDLGHWVVAAPQGLAIVRPLGGGLAVTGDLRASIAGVSVQPWRVVLQGTRVGFAPAAGARPFSLASADRIELYLKPAPGGAGDGDTLFRLEGGKAGSGTLLQRVASDAPVTAALQARLSHLAAFSGRDWGSAVRGWAEAGGGAENLQGQASAGQVSATARGGSLSVGPDGRLVGTVPLELRQAGQALAAMADTRVLDPEAAGTAAAVAAARAQGQSTAINLVLQAGAATLGPVKIGPSPKIG